MDAVGRAASAEEGAWLTFTIPIKTASTANLREHPMAKYRRTKAQKKYSALILPAWKLKPLAIVRMTRFGQRRLDDDNLRSALKSVRDGLAKKLRIDDATPLVRWEYEQEQCAAGHEAVRVEILPA